MHFHVRSGLEASLREEIGSVFGTPRLVAPGIVEVTLEGPLARALAVRTALHVGFPLPRRPAGENLAEVLTEALGAKDSLAIFRAYTGSAGRGKAPARFRLDFAEGHKRAVVWRCAELVRERVPELVNDPKDSTWDVAVAQVGGDLAIELVPRGYVDARFAYREAQVPASSHPTIAVALARLLPRHDDDVVWDPFVGAGAELVERARLGPVKRLLGTDLDPRALDAARANFRRAGVAATLEEADASTYLPKGGVTAIVTNPPMGRRVERGRHADLLERFVVHAASVLRPGGVLVWMDPAPKRTKPIAEAAGLRLDHAVSVDMGGFSAELARWRK